MENQQNSNNKNQNKKSTISEKRDLLFLKIYAKNISALKGGSLPVSYNQSQLIDLVSDQSLLEKGNDQLDLVSIFPVYLN